MIRKERVAQFHFRSSLSFLLPRNLWGSGDLSSLQLGAAWGQRHMMFLGYEATMLALEANRVIGLRLIKIAHGGIEAGREVNLMVQEKIAAAAEAQATLMGGGGIEAVLNGYRRYVVGNAERLSPRSSR
jgi:hypothetical protein